MQVTHIPATLPPASGGQPTAPPRAKAAAPSSAGKGLTVQSFERALVEAVGLSPAEAAKVHVALSVDETTNRVVAQVIDKDTGELLKQIPTDQMLRNAAMIRELLGAAVNAVA